MLGVKEGSDSGHDVLAKGPVAGEDVGVAALFDVLDKQGRIVFREALQSPVSGRRLTLSDGTDLVVGSVVDVDDFGHALGLGGRVGDGPDPAAGYKGGDGAAELGRCGDGGEGLRDEFAVLLLEDGKGRGEA